MRVQIVTTLFSKFYSLMLFVVFGEGVKTNYLNKFVNKF